MTPTMISLWMDGLGEDDGHDAGVVDAQGHVGALAAVGLAADDALGVLDGDLALGLGDGDGAGDDEEGEAEHGDEEEGAGRSLPEHVDGL